MTLAEKLDRALDKADLTVAELAEAVDVYLSQIKRLVEERERAVSVPLKFWKLISVALDVPIEYWLDDDIDGEVTQTLLTVKAIRTQHEEQSESARAWERHIDEQRRKKWRARK